MSRIVRDAEMAICAGEPSALADDLQLIDARSSKARFLQTFPSGPSSTHIQDYSMTKQSWRDRMERVPMTVEGHKRLEEELQRLKSVERPRIIQAIAEARAHGDLSENAEYHSAKEQQGLNEARVADIEDKLSRADDDRSGEALRRERQVRRHRHPARTRIPTRRSNTRSSARPRRTSARARSRSVRRSRAP